MADHVLIIGGTLLDTKGKPDAGLEPGTSNPGRIRSSRGGTARNVAENLALLGTDVMLITAVGNDSTGKKLLEQTAAAGVKVDHALVIDGAHTGAYLALLDEIGSLAVALDDCSVMNHITPMYLHRRRRLFRDAKMIMMDGSLSPPSIKTIVRLATQYNVPLCADPSSSRLAHKLRPYLSQLHLLVPNEVEQAALLEVDYPGYNPEFNRTLAHRLVSMGAEHVVVSLSDFGLEYATNDEVGYIPPSYSKMVDATGTGDAVTAAIMFGILNDLPTVECMRLGAAAASLTLQTTETVVPELSLDMLYDHLIV
ncbi:MAG: carbohydrate kinase family protein [Candidatus Promineifilaceae bacterium]|nr:carbohydrate kinase family protein [Candidatus Promineifilaceae bacterium]